jgi:hypothetical protein
VASSAQVGAGRPTESLDCEISPSGALLTKSVGTGIRVPTEKLAATSLAPEARNGTCR